MRVLRGEVQRAAERVVRARGNIGRALRHFDGSGILRVDIAVGLGAAAIVRSAVRQAVDRDTDLLLAEIVLEAANGHARRPVIKTESVAFLHLYARQVVDLRQDAGDGRLLQRHGFCRLGRRIGLLLAEHDDRVQLSGSVRRFCGVICECCTKHDAQANPGQEAGLPICIHDFSLVEYV